MSSASTSLLVPLDGTEKDSRALGAAAAMAALTGHDVRLVRVFDPPVSSLTERMLTMGGHDAIQKRLVEASHSLKDSSERLAALTGKEVIAEIAEGFDVAQVLLDRAARPDVAAVIMATRAASPPDRALCGSVADRLMRECMRPVLLVPPGVDDSTGPTTLRRVLLPLAGSHPSFAASDCLLELDAGRTLEYILLEVVPESKTASGELIDLANHLRGSGARAVHVRVVADMDPAAIISHTAREENVDLVAMSPRGLSGLQRFVQGSVTERVVRNSTIPVFLLTA